MPAIEGVLFSDATILKSWNQGQFTLALTWQKGRRPDPEPCLVILRKRFAAALARPFAAVIGLSAAHKYTDPAYLISMSIRFAQGMGMETQMEIRQLADVILDNLPELVNCPPPPKELDTPVTPLEVTERHGHIIIAGEEPRH